MDLKLSVDPVVSGANRRSCVESCIHGLAAVLLLSAELLSIIAARHFVELVAELLPSADLAMAHRIG
jgi:hypothetical protein